ncbi:MAG TPA: hypothetical protein VFO52_13970 [Longimicrobiales bacterium]|nr:hypothetical protein [Longimicrobiales bacterium]
MDDLGLYYVNSDRCCGFDNANGLKLIWRQSGNLNLGVHFGTGDIENIGESILIGAELYGGLPGLASSSGLAMAWSLGLGAAFGDVEGVDYIDFSVPVGVSVGIPINAGGATILPYIHPRVSLDVVSVTVNDQEDTDTDVGFAVDIGADVNLGQSLILRTGFALGDRDAFGVGVAFRMARRVVAR